MVLLRPSGYASKGFGCNGWRGREGAERIVLGTFGMIEVIAVGSSQIAMVHNLLVGSSQQPITDNIHPSPSLSLQAL